MTSKPIFTLALSLPFSAALPAQTSSANPPITGTVAAPTGVLGSPLFNKSAAIAGGFFGSAASNRSLDLQASFNF